MKVPAKITAHELENREIDFKRSDMIEDHKKRAIDSKHFIKENMRGINKTQTKFNENIQAN